MWLEWPSAIRGPMREDEAKRVAAAELANWPDHPEDAEIARQAYRLAAFFAENELSDGRGGEPLHAAAENFCDELTRHVGIEHRQVA